MEPGPTTTAVTVDVNIDTKTNDKTDDKTNTKKDVKPKKKSNVKEIKNEVPKTWPTLMQKMDAKGPPIKKIIIRKPKIIKKETQAKPLPPWMDYFIPPDCFDSNKHGYWMRGRDLIYKTPDGKTYPATGCDEFGPFKDAPLKQWNKSNQFNKS